MTADRIPALLEPIQNRLNAATPGPWEDRVDDLTEDLNVWHDQEHVSFVAFCGDKNQPRAQADAEFIANAPTDQACLLAALQAVTALHEHRTGEYRDMHGQCWIGDYCVECRDEWPCPTVVEVVSALDA